MFFLKYIPVIILLASPSIFAKSIVKNAQDCSSKMLTLALKDKNWNQDPEVRLQVNDAFATCLGHYIRLKTISPKGDEEMAVVYLKNIFDKLDIQNKVVQVKDLTGIGKYRYNLVATLPVDRFNKFNWRDRNSRKSIILLNHMDVVGTHPEQWEFPDLDFSGALQADSTGKLYIWGRGALDMKGIAIVQLFNMWIIKKLNIEMQRDLHFLAVADEEQSASGAIGVLQKMQAGNELAALANANLVLNEGGGGTTGLPSPEYDLFLVAAEEKGGAWLEMEHDDPIKLIQDLYKAKIIRINKRIKRKDKKIRGHECKLIEVNTPGAKVNVVASKIFMTFKCREGFQAEFLFKSVFERGFKTVAAKTSQVGDILKMELTTASSSHGSIGLNESVMTAMVMGLYHFDILKIKKNKYLPNYFRYIKTQATSDLVKELGKTNRLIKFINALRFIPFLEKLLLKQLEGEFGVSGWFQTTCQFSAFDFKNRAKALVDCRLLHTGKKASNRNQPQMFISELVKKIKDTQLSINLIDGWDFSNSSSRSSDFKLIRKALSSFSTDKSKVLVVPFLFPAGSDSSWFRNPWTAGSNIKPILSYGFFPVHLTPDLLGAMHGANERFPVDQIVPTVYRYQHTLSALLNSVGVSNLALAKKNFGSAMGELTKAEKKELKFQLQNSL